MLNQKKMRRMMMKKVILLRLSRKKMKRMKMKKVLLLRPDTAAHENGGNENMNVFEHENIDLSEENIEDDIDHTLYSSEDGDDDLTCV